MKSLQPSAHRSQRCESSQQPNVAYIPLVMGIQGAVCVSTSRAPLSRNLCRLAITKLATHLNPARVHGPYLEKVPQGFKSNQHHYKNVSLRIESVKHPTVTSRSLHVPEANVHYLSMECSRAVP